MSVYTSALAGLLLTLSCMDAPREQRAARREPSETAVAPAAPKPAAPVRARVARPAPAPSAAEPIDPTLVPVEEDFRAEVEQRIGRRSNLESELQRVASELSKRQ